MPNYELRIFGSGIAFLDGILFLGGLCGELAFLFGFSFCNADLRRLFGELALSRFFGHYVYGDLMYLNVRASVAHRGTARSCLSDTFSFFLKIF